MKTIHDFASYTSRPAQFLASEAWMKSNQREDLRAEAVWRGNGTFRAKRAALRSRGDALNQTLISAFKRDTALKDDKKKKKKKEKENGSSDVERRSRGRARRDDD